MSHFLGFPRSHNAFYRKHKFLESAEHIHVYYKEEQANFPGGGGGGGGGGGQINP